MEARSQKNFSSRHRYNSLACNGFTANLSSVQNRWMLYGFKQNIPRLLEEVSKPEISPEVLHLLESPEYQGYYILLWPQPKERHNDKNMPEATDK